MRLRVSIPATESDQIAEKILESAETTESDETGEMRQMVNPTHKINKKATFTDDHTDDPNRPWTVPSDQ
jgi:hypothetical protein